MSGRHWKKTGKGRGWVEIKDLGTTEGYVERSGAVACNRWIYLGKQPLIFPPHLLEAIYSMDKILTWFRPRLKPDGFGTWNSFAYHDKFEQPTWRKTLPHTWILISPDFVTTALHCGSTRIVLWKAKSVIRKEHFFLSPTDPNFKEMVLVILGRYAAKLR